MGSRLINVRLDAERLRKARVLRARGVVLSDIVRAAIDQQFDRLATSRAPDEVRAIVARVFEEHPDPSDLPPRTYDVHDRLAARRAIGRTLGRKRR